MPPVLSAVLAFVASFLQPRQTLQHLVTSYFIYYHDWRTHLSLAMDCPKPRPIEPPGHGRVITVSEVGGLHHRYKRVAA
jgi:putative transposase